MRLDKKLVINELNFGTALNAPLVLRAHACLHHIWSNLEANLDRGILDRTGFRPLEDLIGKSIIVCLESSKLERGLPSSIKFKKGDLLIKEVVKKVKCSWEYSKAHAPLKNDEIIYTASFETTLSEEGRNATSLPCPFYKLNLEIDEGEYIGLRQLSPYTIMRLNFNLESQI